MDGETRYFSAKLSPILFNEVYSGSVAVVRDITERRQAKKTIDRRP
jgi:PAS domain-containing protein